MPRGNYNDLSCNFDKVKCIYCRTRWEQDPESIKKAHMKDGYLNLSMYQDRSLRNAGQLPASLMLLLPQILRYSSRLQVPWSIPFDDSSDDDDYHDDVGLDTDDGDEEDESDEDF
jgi:hypothetical protein